MSEGAPDISTSVSDRGVPSPPRTRDLYQAPAADVVLRSSDTVDFFAFKAVLSLASPVFAGMFALDQLPPSAEQQQQDGLPVVTLTEHSNVLEAILLQCHPGHPSSIAEQTSSVLFGVAKAALKYEMEGVLARLRIALGYPPLLKTDVEALRVYIVSTTCRFPEEAKAAAIRLLEVPLAHRPYVQELREIQAADLWHLYDHFSRCVDAATNVVDARRWSATPLPSPPNSPAPPRPIWWTCTHCTGRKTRSSPFSLPVARLWWDQYMEEAYEALSKRPVGSTVQNTHLVDKATQNALDCYSCKSGLGAFRRFTDCLAAAVDDAVSRVEIWVDPSPADIPEVFAA